jgi:hypothetical protein
MADNIPFGLTFGNPSKYMGQSPLADIGKAAKSFGVAYGLQKSGAVDFLNGLGIKQDKQGGWGYNPPAGAAAPPMGPASGADMDVYSSGFGGIAPPSETNPNADAFMQQAQNQVKLNKSMVPNANGIVGAVVPNMAPTPGVEVTPVTDNFPSDIGHQILDGNDSWQGSSVDPQAQRDSLVLPQQQTVEAPRLTGNEYQQVPGYGSAKKAAMAMFGMG